MTTDSLSSLLKAKRLATDIAVSLEDVPEELHEKILAVGIVFGSMAALSGLSLHKATALLMDIYKMADNQKKEFGNETH